MGTFQAISEATVCQLLHGAHRNVLYASPGVFLGAAEEMVRFIGSGENRSLCVVLDPDPEICRLGYGQIEGLELLNAKGIRVRKAPGLRIGILIIDDKAFVYSPTPLVVEDPPGFSAYNGLMVLPEQARSILECVASEGSPEDQVLPSGDALKNPKLGAELMSREEIEASRKDIDERPPLKFNLARPTRVYQSYIQFVEVSLLGCHVQRHTVSLPSQLLNMPGGKEMQERLTAQFRVIEKDLVAVGKGKDRISLEDIKNDVNRLRKQYLKSLGEKYGVLMLRKNKSEFETGVEEIELKLMRFKDECTETLRKEFLKSKNHLVSALLPGLCEHPPEDLLFGITTKKPSKEIAKRYLEDCIDSVFPRAEDFVEEMRLNVVFRDVTYETLTDPNFGESIREAFPYVEWPKPLEEHTAIPEARESEDGFPQ